MCCFDVVVQSLRMKVRIESEVARRKPLAFEAEDINQQNICCSCTAYATAHQKDLAREPEAHFSERERRKKGRREWFVPFRVLRTANGAL